jgi:two-component system, NarL family, sensor kinase
MNLETEFLASSGAALPAPLAELKSHHALLLEAPGAAAVAETMQQLIDDLPEEIALLDQQCNILAVNQSWLRMMEVHHHLDSRPGNNYRDLCVTRAAQGHQPAVEALAALDQVSSGNRSDWQLVYNGGESWSGRDFQLCFHRIGEGDQAIIAVTRFDLTESLELRRLKHDFSNSLIKTQATERQRMARELHDSISQLLTGVGLLLARLKHQSPDPESQDVVDELQDLVGQAQQEVRLVSYLAHPPALEKMGLGDALKSVAEGFGSRTGLETSFEIHGEDRPLPVAAQSAIYRVAQEALSNVHRHAHATRVRLLLCFRRSASHLVVADDGIGISRETLGGSGGAGVGLSSMRERLSEIGGRLSVRPLPAGTAIVASVPKQLF